MCPIFKPFPDSSCLNSSLDKLIFVSGPVPGRDSISPASNNNKI